MGPANLLFNFKKKKRTRTACDIKETFGEEMTSEWSARKWFKRFRRFEDCECSGRSSLIDDDQLKIVIEKDPRKTTRKLIKRKLPATICMRSENQKSLGNRYHTIWIKIRKCAVMKVDRRFITVTRPIPFLTVQLTVNSGFCTIIKKVFYWTTRDYNTYMGGIFGRVSNTSSQSKNCFHV